MSAAAERDGRRPKVGRAGLVCDGVRFDGAVRGVRLVRVRCWSWVGRSRFVRVGRWSPLREGEQNTRVFHVS